MSKQTVYSQDCDSIKDGLLCLLNEQITVIVKDKTKFLVKKGKLVSVSNNLFSINVPLGKSGSSMQSFTFLDIKTGKVRIKEAPNLSTEVAQVV